MLKEMMVRNGCESEPIDVAVEFAGRLMLAVQEADRDACRFRAHSYSSISPVTAHEAEQCAKLIEAQRYDNLEVGK